MEDSPGAGTETSGREGESFSTRTVRATKWRIALVASNVPVQFAVGVVLARLLPPEDFGLLALAMIVIGFVDIVVRESLNPAVVQRRPLTERHVRVAFTLSVLMGVVLTAVVYGAAPLSAELLDDPAVPRVLRMIALVFFVNGFGNIGSALLWRKLDFRRVYFIVISSYVLGYGLVSIVLAVLGFGVWSLVFGTLARHLLESCLVLLWVRHPKKPLLAGQELRDLAGAGVGFSLRAVANYLTRQGDHFVVGRWLGSRALGLYSRAIGLMRMPTQHLETVIHNVLFPALSEVQDDRVRFTRGYIVSVQLTSLLVAPVMAGMIVAAPHLIGGIYGENWLGAVGPLQVLCAGGLFHALYPVDRIVAEAMGEVYRVVPRMFFYAALVVAGGIALADGGVTAVAAAVSGSAAVMYALMVWLTRRLVDLSWRDVVTSMSGGMALAIGVAGTSVLARVLLESWSSNSLVILAGILAVCAATYVAGIRLLPGSIRPAELFRVIGSRQLGLPDRLHAWLVRFLQVSEARERPFNRRKEEEER